MITKQSRMANCQLACFCRKSAFFWKMLSVTLHYEPINLKMSSASRGAGNEPLCQVLYQRIPETGKNMPPKVLIWPYLVAL